MSEAWQDTDSDTPRFGRKAQAWLRRKLRTYLFERHDSEGYIPALPDRFGFWKPEAVDRLLETYLETPNRYVAWVDAATYSGAGFSSGAWKLDDAAIERDWRLHVDAIDRTRDRIEYPTLDEWLKADIADTLYFRGETGGMVLVPKSAPVATLPGKGERECNGCTAMFVPMHGNTKHCDACRASRANSRGSRKPGSSQ